MANKNPGEDYRQDPEYQALMRHFKDLDRISQEPFNSYVRPELVVFDLSEMVSWESPPQTGR